MPERNRVDGERVSGRAQRDVAHVREVGLLGGAHVVDDRTGRRGRERRVVEAGESLEAPREVRPVFEGLELRLGERVVVGDVGPRVGLGDGEAAEEVGA